MPRIRKKTSKRGTTHQRQKIKHKVAETRKKRKKEAKKNPQWKSKKLKDPGIPNNFPYKDQILAEIAAQRRQAEEEKQRRKEAKKAARAEQEGRDSQSPEPEVGFSSLPSSSKATFAAPESSKPNIPVENDEEAPILLNPDLPNLKAVLDKADVVIELLDARDPLAFRSDAIENAAGSKKLLFVLNKVDTVPREIVESWYKALSKDHPVYLFRAASAFLPGNEATAADVKGKGKKRADDALGLQAVSEKLEALAKEKDSPLVVAVVGWTNSGKSSFVNSLLRKSSLSIYKLTSTSGEGPSTTMYPQEISLTLGGKEITLIDTPGLSWQTSLNLAEEDAEKFRTQDILMRSKGHIERLKAPVPVVSHIVSRATKEDLMTFYNIPAFQEGDVDAFLAGVARANNLVKKGGLPDIAAASRIVLRDWGTGKLPRYAAPSPSLLLDAPALGGDQQKILSQLRTRKEMRGADGLVKLRSGDIEKRGVDLEAPWIEVEESSDEDEDDEGSAEEEDESTVTTDGIDEEDDEDDEEENEEESEDDEEEKPKPGKRKQAPTKPEIRPKKKVAFAATATVRTSKQVRAKAKNASSPQKPVAPAKAKSSSAAPKKSALKPTKVANSATKGKSSGKSEDGAYDFSKFF
ncbi:hypothetical protein K474DRAFT_1658485 [Panus rudis PR-1116 ss-1]|nr:hypothetical protein K474DRAFT_1658485 [Panus rudis PR-1116 ss-1]